jgi:hypothetical protein
MDIYLFLLLIFVIGLSVYYFQDRIFGMKTNNETHKYKKPNIKKNKHIDTVNSDTLSNMSDTDHESQLPSLDSNASMMSGIMSQMSDGSLLDGSQKSEMSNESDMSDIEIGNGSVMLSKSIISGSDISGSGISDLENGNGSYMSDLPYVTDIENGDLSVGSGTETNFKSILG